MENKKLTSDNLKEISDISQKKELTPSLSKQNLDDKITLHPVKGQMDNAETMEINALDRGREYEWDKYPMVRNNLIIDLTLN